MEPVLAGLTLIDLAVVAGIAVVVPLGLGRSFGPWVLAAVAADLGLRLAPGSWLPVALVLPWAAGSLLTLGDVLRRSGVWTAWGTREVGRVVVAAWSAAAAGSLVVSQLGATPFDIGEPIVELAAVHFTYVGVGATVLAAAAAARPWGRRSRTVGTTGFACTVVAPPIVAFGFVSGGTVLPQVGGVVLLTVGVWLTAGLELGRAWRGRLGPAPRALLAVSGLAVWAPMVLAVLWAAGQHWDVPVLSIPDMVRTHGAANALGFIGAGLVAVRLDRSTQEVR